MTTLLTTIFYLWLVITILLAAMWFLRRQDRLREDQPDEDVLLPAAQSPLSETAKNDTEAGTAADPESPTEAEPVPEAESESVAAESESESESESVAAADEETDAAEEDTTATAEPESIPNEPISANTELVEEPTDLDPEDQLPEDQPSEDTDPEETVSEEVVDTEVAGTNGSGPAGETAEPTVEQLLDGITLPFDLAPMPTAIAEPSRHAVFLSSHPDPEEVGTAFADRLVELGFDIEAAGFDRAHAIRDGQVLSLRITADAANNGDAGRYPDADEGDVAIEVWTGDGPPPPLES